MQMEEREIRAAAGWIREAKALIITAGTGIGVDSELPFLKLIGLKFGDRKLRYVEGKKIYSYGLDLDSLERMQLYSAHFRAGLKGAYGAWNIETGEWDLVVKDADGAATIKRKSNAA